MAGKKVQDDFIQADTFSPDEEIDKNRTPKEKRKGWRFAEENIMGKRWVNAHEDRIKSRQKLRKVLKRKNS